VSARLTREQAEQLSLALDRALKDVPLDPENVSAERVAPTHST
jgi:hypothetical protein